MSMKEKVMLEYNPILKYYGEIESGKVIVCRKTRLIYKYLAYIIENPEHFTFHYDHFRASHAIYFIENYCRQVKGKAKLIKLELWQKAFVGSVFGFIENDTNLRQFREVLDLIPRKQGKSTIGAGIGNYCLTSDNEVGPEVYVAATKEDQAKIVWNVAKQMIQKEPRLVLSSKNKKGFIKCKTKIIENTMNDGVFKPLGSDSDTLDGLDVHCAILDEIHAWKTRELYDVIIDGNQTRREPLTIAITTQGFTRNSIMDDLYQKAENVIDDIEAFFIELENGKHLDIRTPRFLPVIYELDKGDDWREESSWFKANPGLGTIKQYQAFKDKVEEVKNEPRRQRNFLTKDFNVRGSGEESWLDYAVVHNSATYDIRELKPKYAIGGVDLSSTTDLTAATILFRIPDDETIYRKSMYWLPEDHLERRVEEDKVPYDIWKERGLLRVSAGNKIDYKDITDWFKEIREEYGVYISYLGYDEWGAKYWVDEMKSEFGANVMQVVRQGAKTLSTPMKLIEAELEAKHINYDNNPIDKTCLLNTSIEEDTNGNIKPVKGKRGKRKRIDGTIALLNAYTVYLDNQVQYMNMINM